MIYGTLLALHNVTRWLVLLFGAWALIRLIGGWASNRDWTTTDRASMRWFALILSLQFVFGAALYFLPGSLVQSTLGGLSMGEIMGARILRFFTVEHPLQMLIAIGVSHTANMVVRRIGSDRRRFRVGTLLIGLAMLLIVTAIPWPFLSHGRPLYRLP